MHRCNCTRSEATYYLESYGYAEEEALRAHSRDLAFERERALLDESIRERDAAEAAACASCDDARADDGSAHDEREHCAGLGTAADERSQSEVDSAFIGGQAVAPALGCFTQCLPPPPKQPQSCAS